jgi:hypothetical protein
MGFPKKEILIACVNTSFVLKILKTTRNKQRFPNKEMLMSYMTKLRAGRGIFYTTTGLATHILPLGRGELLDGGGKKRRSG